MQKCTPLEVAVAVSFRTFRLCGISSLRVSMSYIPMDRVLVQIPKAPLGTVGKQSFSLWFSLISYLATSIYFMVSTIFCSQVGTLFYHF